MSLQLDNQGLVKKKSLKRILLYFLVCSRAKVIFFFSCLLFFFTVFFNLYKKNLAINEKTAVGMCTTFSDKQDRHLRKTLTAQSVFVLKNIDLDMSPNPHLSFSSLLPVWAICLDGGLPGCGIIKLMPELYNVPNSPGGVSKERFP